ncbi:MAG TPA: Asp-tRNA(Asn)/Glu-tRNA(Gln) amidotransferase GatCAB subunit B, partial [Burkholderiales bacterium]|nr:Asp-tRNA(Asn)/Glu-tRNA(Gln) amidotransferase GatCAB subunit B [Burkholderiales bacterium]
VRRQVEILGEGGNIVQETRLYDPDRDETRSMRSKEDAQDYRYFPDPDLLPLIVTEEMIEKVRATTPELPEARRQRFVREYALPAYDAGGLTASRAAADYFEAMLKASGADPKLCANWQMGELAAALNREERDIAASRMPPEHLGWIVRQVGDGQLTGKMAKRVFEVAWEGGVTPQAVVEKEGLKPISDAGEVEKLIDQVLAANAKQVEDYRGGKEKAFNSLVGQVMKATKGKANPAQVNEILRRKLAR